MEHSLSLSQRSVEHLVVATTEHATHKFMANFYDRSEQTFKYEMELEVTLL